MLYGVVGDLLGVPAALLVVAGVVTLTLPLSLALRPALAAMGKEIFGVEHLQLVSRRKGVGEELIRP